MGWSDPRALYTGTKPKSLRDDPVVLRLWLKETYPDVFEQSMTAQDNPALLRKWVQQTHPDIFKQFMAVQDIQEVSNE